MAQPDEMTQPLCGWIIIFIHDPRVAEAATLLGWRTQPLCGFVPGTEVDRFRKLDYRHQVSSYKQSSLVTIREGTRKDRNLHEHNCSFDAWPKWKELVVTIH